MECGSGERFLEPSHEVFKSLNLQLFGAVSGASFVKQFIMCRSSPSFLGSFLLSHKRGGETMNPIKTHVAGVDVHKDILAITVMIGPEEGEPKIEHF
jgi:hypothetical protein